MLILWYSYTKLFTLTDSSNIIVKQNMLNSACLKSKFQMSKPHELYPEKLFNVRQLVFLLLIYSLFLLVEVFLYFCFRIDVTDAGGPKKKHLYVIIIFSQSLVQCHTQWVGLKVPSYLNTFSVSLPPKKNKI